jgi:hypothetical protein
MLPNISKSMKYQELTLPKSKKKIRMRAYVLKYEKDLLIRIGDRKNQKLVYNSIKEFLNACVHEEDSDIFKNIGKEDFAYLILIMRQITKGDMLSIKHKCVHCQYPNEIQISIETDLKMKIPEKNEISLLDGTLILKLKDISLDEEIERAEKAELSTKSEEDEKIKMIYDTIYASISEVVYEGEIFSTFSPEELISFIDQLPGSENEKLLKGIMSLSTSIKLEKDTFCLNPKCKKEIKVSVDSIKSFFI